MKKFKKFCCYFLLLNASFCFSCDPQELYFDLQQKTNEHISYLKRKGLEERAKSIQLRWVDLQEPTPFVDLTSFQHRTSLPEEALLFDPSKKNTLITTDPIATSNRSEDIESLLDIRLYPALRQLLTLHKTFTFLGTKDELLAYCQAEGWNLLFEFQIPSSATYYLAKSIDKKIYMILAGLVSRENWIAQAITLKLAGIDISQIEGIGQINHFTQLVTQDIQNILQQWPELKTTHPVLIIAGCGLQEKVNQIIQSELAYEFQPLSSFQGNIVSLSYLPLKSPINGIGGFLSLNLNYGEIMEEIVHQILENCHCAALFTGSAGGYIPSTQACLPQIGDRITFTSSLHENGKEVDLANQGDLTSISSSLHLHVPSIFVETYEWLEQAKTKKGSTVDVETFYIMRAVQNYKNQYPQAKIKVDFGCFISDYVGLAPLRDYSHVYQNYPTILMHFLKEALSLEL